MTKTELRRHYRAARKAFVAGLTAGQREQLERILADVIAPALTMVRMAGRYAAIGDEIDPATGIERTYPITESFVRSGRLMMLCTTAGFLDLFDYVPGFPDEPVATVWNTAVKLDGVRFASLEWLRRMKQAAGRPKDLLDLENLPEPN
jgi:hypothetical protein